MRTIKFRAWFKPIKRMYIVKELRFNRDNSIVIITNYNGGTAPNSYELMQSTGLKDKNGKEIYEGDIIKGIWGIKEIDVFQVYWDNHGWLGKGKQGDYSFGDYHTFEVIGNIYENPELLEDLNGS